MQPGIAAELSDNELEVGEPTAVLYVLLESTVPAEMDADPMSWLWLAESRTDSLESEEPGEVGGLFLVLLELGKDCADPIGVP